MDDLGPLASRRARTHSLSAKSEDSYTDAPRPPGDTQPEADALTVDTYDDDFDAGNSGVGQLQDELFAELQDRP